MHNDEEHPHLHFYVYSDTEVNAKMLHDGYKNGSSPKAYKKGCEDFQNEYFEQVASRCGLAPRGPTPPPLACRVARGAGKCRCR